LQHLRKSGTQTPDDGSTPTQTFVAVQKELETTSGQLDALRLTLVSVDADLVTEQKNHQNTNDTL